MLETGTIYTVIEKCSSEEIGISCRWEVLEDQTIYYVCFQWGGGIHSIGGILYFLELQNGKNKLLKKFLTKVTGNSFHHIL